MFVCVSIQWVAVELWVVAVMPFVWLEIIDIDDLISGELRDVIARKLMRF